MQFQKELYNKHHNTADGRIRVWFGLRQIMNATDQLLLKTRDAADELKTGIHMVFILVSTVFSIFFLENLLLFTYITKVWNFIWMDAVLFYKYPKKLSVSIHFLQLFSTSLELFYLYPKTSLCASLMPFYLFEERLIYVLYNMIFYELYCDVKARKLVF